MLYIFFNPDAGNLVNLKCRLCLSEQSPRKLFFFWGFLCEEVAVVLLKVVLTWSTAGQLLTWGPCCVLPGLCEHQGSKIKANRALAAALWLFRSCRTQGWSLLRTQEPQLEL